MHPNVYVLGYIIVANHAGNRIFTLVLNTIYDFSLSLLYPALSESEGHPRGAGATGYVYK